MLPALLQRLKWEVSQSVLKPHAATQPAWPLPQKKASSEADIQRMAHKQLAKNKQTKSMDYWNHVMWSDKTKINLFGSKCVQHVWWQPFEE